MYTHTHTICNFLIRVFRTFAYYDVYVTQYNTVILHVGMF